MSSILPFLSIKFTKVELCSEIRGFSSDSPSAAAIKIEITLPRISASGSSRPRSRNGISYRRNHDKIPVSKAMKHTEDNSVAYVLRGHALITDIRATREAVCSVISTVVVND